MHRLAWGDLQESELAALLKVSRGTLRRWIAGKQAPPAYAVDYARLLIRGELHPLDAAWEGWCVRGGQLLGPHPALHFTPGELTLWPNLVRLARAYDRRPAQLELF